MPLSPEQVRELVAFGREQPGVEFKCAGERTDPAFRARVIRGMLALTNRRDGGVLIIGVKEETGGLQLDGLSGGQLATWKHDDLANSVAEYADPRVSFDSYLVDVDGNNVVVIAVAEFADVPVICKRSYNAAGKTILRDGAVYVRSNRKPESREVANFDEMRELLDIATDKGVRRFVTRAEAAGLGLGKVSTFDHEAAFKAERGTL